MNLYLIQTDDPDIYVVANSMDDAIDKWRKKCAKEDPDNDYSCDEPDGVQYVVFSDFLII